MEMPARIRLRKQTKTWVVVVPRPGKKNPATTDCGAGDAGRAAAEELAARFNAETAAADGWLAGNEAAPLPTDATLRAWLAASRHSVSHSFEGNARSVIERHLAPYFGARDLRSLTPADCEGLGAKMLDAGLSPSTFAVAGSIMRTVCGRHVPKYLPANPFHGLGPLVRKMQKRHATGGRRRDAWTREELAKILDLARAHEPGLLPRVIVAAYTGMRKGEVLGLCWDSIDFATGRIVVRDSIVRGHRGVPKSGRERIVPMDRGGRLLRGTLAGLAAGRRVREPWQGADLVFRRRSGAPIDEREHAREWERLSQRFTDAGVRPLDFHSFRHTFVSLALGAGVPLFEVGSWVGHSSQRMTELYAHLVPSTAADGFLEARDLPVTNRDERHSSRVGDSYS